MSKRTLLTSLTIGLVLTLISLIRVEGQSPSMVPCAGVGPGCIAGVVVRTPQADIIGHRGWPLAALYIQSDEDGYTTYEGYSSLGLIGDLAIFSLVGLGAMIVVKKVRS